ncbi:hypothetical protein ACQY0O_005370 [Thecaphora frezii]
MSSSRSLEQNAAPTSSNHHRHTVAPRSRALALFSAPTALALVVVGVSIVLALLFRPAALNAAKLSPSLHSPATTANMATSNSSASSAWRAPAWFLSHGGPPTMFMENHPAYKRWAEVGQVMQQAHREGKLKGLIFVSAHWQADDLADGVYVNVDEENPLVYDFYGFPPDFYEVKVASRNPAWFSSVVLEQLRANGVKAVPIKRGPDHGVWVPLKVGFGGPDSHSSRLPDDLSLVQVSLPRSEKPIDSLRLGRALRGLRDRGYAVIGGGQAVHNLGDFGRMRATGITSLPPYSFTFPEALTAAVLGHASDKAGGEVHDAWTQPNEDKWSEALTLDQRPDFVQAHPTYEHFLPALVALGASLPQEAGKETLHMNEGPLVWKMYEWESQPHL